MNERDLDLFNQSLRANPAYQQFLRSIGVNTSVPAGQAWRLSDQQRKQAEAWVRRNVQDIGDLEIDISGNANQNEGVGKYAKDWKTYAAIGGGLTGLGAFGIGPLSGLFGAGAGAGTGAAAGGELAAGSIPTSLAMQAVPASIASQGVSAGLGAGLAGAGGAGAAGAAGAAAGGGGLASGLASAGKKALSGLASPSGAAGLAALIAGLASSRNSTQNSDEIQRIQAINEARMRRADPLHQVAVNLAFGRLPTNYRQGVDLQNIPLPR